MSSSPKKRAEAHEALLKANRLVTGRNLDRQDAWLNGVEDLLDKAALGWLDLSDRVDAAEERLVRHAEGYAVLAERNIELENDLALWKRTASLALKDAAGCECDADGLRLLVTVKHAADALLIATGDDKRIPSNACPAEFFALAAACSAADRVAALSIPEEDDKT